MNPFSFRNPGRPTRGFVDGGNPGAWQNGPTASADVPSVISANVYSLSFDGVNDYVSFLTAVDFKFGAAVSLWFKLAGAIMGNEIPYGHSGSDSSMQILSPTSIKVRSSSSEAFDYAVPTINVTLWHHVLVNRATSGSTRLYLDGTESSTGAQTFSTAHPLINQLAKHSSGIVYFPGKEAEFQVFDQELLAGDIAALYAGTPTSISPILRYKLNESTGFAVADYGRVYS